MSKNDSKLVTKVSSLIEGQVPDFVQSDHPQFVKFLKDYYQFLEAGRLTLEITVNYIAQETTTSNYIIDETTGERIVTEIGEGTTGQFVEGETITGGTSNATATVLVDDSRNSYLYVTSQQRFETGETIPDELIEKLLKAGKFNQGFINTEYLAASLLDMDWHTLSLQDAKNISNNFENNSMNKIGLIDEIAPRYRSTYFAHIFSGGYSSGYYSYVHAAVLDSDAFEAFKEAGDVFDPELSASLRKNIYEKGSTEEAMDLYVNFRGRKPIIEPLLKVRGLDGSSD